MTSTRAEYLQPVYRGTIMRISSRIDYAVSALLIIAVNYSEGKAIPVKKVSEEISLAVDYVEQLLITLKRAGIVNSLRGVKGGYLLADSPENIKMLGVVEAFEKDVLELACNREKGRKDKCVYLDNCNVKEFWIGLRDVILSYLNGKTLADLVALRKMETA